MFEGKRTFLGDLLGMGARLAMGLSRALEIDSNHDRDYSFSLSVNITQVKTRELIAATQMTTVEKNSSRVAIQPRAQAKTPVKQKQKQNIATKGPKRGL